MNKDETLRPRLRTVGVLVASICVAAFVLRTRDWPLISDAVLMHYVGFLIRHGFAPYRDIADPNMPGVYLLDLGSTWLFGSGAVAWRVFDVSLLLTAAAAMMVITRRHARTTGFLAGSLFALLHGADGVAHAGERDIVVAVLLLAGCASLFSALRGGRFLFLAWGVCAGCAASIKPQAAAAGIALSLLAAAVARKRGHSAIQLLAFSLAGAAIPIAACLVFLLREHALGSFLTTTRALVLFHASLGRHTLPFLLGHALPAQLLPLVLVAAAGAWKRSAWSRWEAAALLTCAGWGFFSFVLQGKAYSYHRATLIAFLLPWAMAQLVHSAQKGSRSLRPASIAALAYAVLWLMPASTVRALRWDTREPTLVQLQRDLTALEQADPQLADRGIQCLDTTAGCITVLSRMQAVQATGFLYDCYFFAPEGGPVVEQQRALFRAALGQRLPRVFVVTDQYCFGLPSSYRKLDEWPQLRELLEQEYTLAVERSAADLPRRGLAAWPFGYRIYVRNTAGGAGS